MIELLANLRVVIIIVAAPCRILDLLDVSMLGEISGLLDRDTRPRDAWHYALHQFELRDVPVIDWLVGLPTT